MSTGKNINIFLLLHKYNLLMLKGTVQQDFLPPTFSQIGSSQAPYSVFKDFLNSALNSMTYIFAIFLLTLCYYL
jgi:hypothetical protein